MGIDTGPVVGAGTSMSATEGAHATRMTWTPERIDAFWRYWAGRSDAREDYFAFQVGGGVVKLLGAAVPLAGRRVLDFGCGPGFLIGHLLEAGARVVALDSSGAAVEAANAAFHGRPGWMGASVIRDDRAPFEDGSFDVVCCLETIEHVSEQASGGLVAEIARLLAVGGTALFTTPHAEDLSRSMIFCPACGGEFHKVQHVSSWTEGALSDTIGAAGLSVRFCGAVDLASFLPAPGRSPVHWSPAWIARRTLLAAAGLMDRIAPRPFPTGRVFRSRARKGGPHLVAVAERIDG